MDSDPSIPEITGESAATLVISGSGSHWPKYCSRFTRADCNWLIQRRVITVTRKARGSLISAPEACCHRRKVSCSISSASARLPSMRYAIEKSRPRCWWNAVRPASLPTFAGEDPIASDCDLCEGLGSRDFGSWSSGIGFLKPRSDQFDRVNSRIEAATRSGSSHMGK